MSPLATSASLLTSFGPSHSPAYQQTSDEYQASRAGVNRTIHRELVRVALAAHLPVPKRVLAEYPDLVRQEGRSLVLGRITD